MAKKKTVKSNSKTKPSVPSNVFAPDYITVNGHVYERTAQGSVNLELDLEEDVLDQIDGLVTDGKYVSRGDAVRDILRNMIDREQLNK